jgi:hypothetical protein
MLVSRSLFLMILGSESGRLGCQKQAFGERGVAQTIFHRSWNSVDFRVHSWVKWEPQLSLRAPKIKKKQEKRTLGKHHKNNTAGSGLLLRFLSKMGLGIRGGSAPKITIIIKTLQPRKRNPILSLRASKITKNQNFDFPKPGKCIADCPLFAICLCASHARHRAVRGDPSVQEMQINGVGTAHPKLAQNLESRQLCKGKELREQREARWRVMRAAH